ncbi:MAG TPA: hypothetical protein DCZ92_00085 [Elusimicrobia bacterium]|nr:MAG: hypothetical protein A2016_12645 [Elusimicrobia bacterium GWF2_62_30]HBA59225.1 hypothetical protein [Elusimicrobiota bacterium]
MKLNKHVKARKEGESYYLHHAANGGLLKISTALYEKMTAGQEEFLPDDFLAKLRGMEMLAGTENGGGDPVSTGRIKRTGFLGLRSAKSPFHVFWELTTKCTLTCLYCFPDMKSKRTEGRKPDLDAASLGKVADRIIEAELFKVTLTGGEAMLRPDFWDIVKKLEDNGVMVSVITNGVYMPDEFIEKIKKTSLLIAVSLDAPDEGCNRITRGPDAFAKTLGTIQRLAAAGVRTSSIITVTRHNFTLLEDTVKLLRDNGVFYITLQDLKPFGNKEVYDNTRLTAAQEAELPAKLNYLEKKYSDIGFMFTELAIFGDPSKERPCSGKLMDCPAGDHFGYIDYLGNFFPCNMLRSFNMGNVIETGIPALWQNSDAIRELRRVKALPLSTVEKCASCSRKGSCHGGCRGDALFYDGKLDGVPSRCPERRTQAAAQTAGAL